MNWIGVVAVVATASAFCAQDDRPARPVPATEGEAATARPPSELAPAAPIDEGPNSLTGRWKLVMGTMTWSVQLAPRPGLPGEYIGVGARETRDEAGKPVTMEVAAVVEGSKQETLRAWLGLGVIKCKGTFRPAGVTEGNCTEMGGEAAGPFRAERLR